jgi:hypothetical protein
VAELETEAAKDKPEHLKVAAREVTVGEEVAKIVQPAAELNGEDAQPGGRRCVWLRSRHKE